MPLYAYKARDRSGERVTGSASAPSEQYLARALRGHHLVMTSARVASPGTSRRAGGARLSRGELVAFCYQVQTIAAAGVPIVAGLGALAQQADGARFRSVLTDLIDDIEQGASLSEALERRPGTFPRLLVSLVRSGEATGRLDMAVGRAGDYLQWWNSTRSALLQATIYPAILMTAVGGLVLLLVTFLVPRVASLFSRTGAPLPLPTRILVGAAGLLRAHWLIAALVVAAAAVGVIVLRRTLWGRGWIDELKLRAPLFGRLVRKVCSARLTNTLSVLHHAGVGVVEALDIAAQTVGNVVMARAVQDARQQVGQGRSISEALAATGQFQPLVTRMIGVGEQTGSLEATMERVNEFYSREVERGVKALLTVLEPAMIAAAGAMVGFILLSCFLPLFKLLSLLRHR